MPKNNADKPRSKVSLAGKRKIKYHFNSFFAGIGGFDLGLQRVGIAPAFHCEINKYCNSVLSRHWPGVPSNTDIKLVSPRELPNAEIWCGGFPCQDVSLARSWRGREGLQGERSGLFFPFFELIKKKKPKIVVLENVVGLLSSHGGKDFQAILESLTSAGYAISWRVINTRYFGLPQSRPRVYICAWHGNLSNAIGSLYEKQIASTPKHARMGFITPSRTNRSHAIVPKVAYCLAATSGRHTGTDWSRSYVSYHDQVRRMTPRECEGLQGFPIDWSFPGDDFHLPDDEIDTMRYHALGNAVSVAVVEWIGKRLITQLSSDENKITGRVSISSLTETVENTTKEFSLNRGTIRRIKNIKSDESVKWKSGGYAFRDFVVDGPVSPAPVRPIDSELIDVIEELPVDQKYFISPNAAEGILRRVNGQGRTLFDPLHDALVQLANKNKLAKNKNRDTSISVGQQLPIFG